MIDTVRVILPINKKISNIISIKSDKKISFNQDKKLLYYEITSDSLIGSFDSRLSVRVEEGSKYHFRYFDILIIEGSYHKIMKGQNAYDGFINLQEIVLGYKRLVEKNYNVVLPGIRHWFLQRVDIAKCFDLKDQKFVTSYINNFRFCNYPRRNVKFFENECVYISGQTTTLKVYNKFLEFLKNDKKRVSKFENFNYVEFCNKIFGYIRFECEIKKKKLKDIFKCDYLRCDRIFYKELESVWNMEFNKVLKFDCDNIKIVRDKEEVMNRLFQIYKSRTATVVYSFYLNILIDGYKSVQSKCSSSTFYRNLKYLKSAGVDFSQNANLVYEFDTSFDFNPFNYLDVV